MIVTIIKPPSSYLPNVLSLIFLYIKISLITCSSEHHVNCFEGDIIITCEEITRLYGNEAANIAKQDGVCLEKNHDNFQNITSTDAETNNNSNNDDDDVNTITTQSIASLSDDDLWKTRRNDRTIIPYAIQRGDFSQSIEQHIATQLHVIENDSGVVTFVPRTVERDYILVRKGEGCSSHVGRASPTFQPQILTLNDRSCMAPGTIQHEFLHALGFWHEHNRPDRDQYIQIITSNIIPSMRQYFTINANAKTLGSTYDYGSIMHYPEEAFTMNNLPTIQTTNAAADIGQRRKMSDGDILKLRLLYQCASGPRHIQQFRRRPCNKDCPCWDGAMGCDGDDQACQGRLICRRDMCVSSVVMPMLPPQPRPSSSSVNTPWKRQKPGGIRGGFNKGSGNLPPAVKPPPITPLPIRPPPITPAPITSAPITPAPTRPPPTKQPLVKPPPIIPALLKPPPIAPPPIAPPPTKPPPLKPPTKKTYIRGNKDIRGLKPPPVKTPLVKPPPITSSPITLAPITSAPITLAPITLPPTTPPLVKPPPIVPALLKPPPPPIAPPPPLTKPPLIKPPPLTKPPTKRTYNRGRRDNNGGAYRGKPPTRQTYNRFHRRGFRPH